MSRRDTHRERERERERDTHTYTHTHTHTHTHTQSERESAKGTSKLVVREGIRKQSIDECRIAQVDLLRIIEADHKKWREQIIHALLIAHSLRRRCTDKSNRHT